MLVKPEGDTYGSKPAAKRETEETKRSPHNDIDEEEESLSEQIVDMEKEDEEEIAPKEGVRRPAPKTRGRPPTRARSESSAISLSSSGPSGLFAERRQQKPLPLNARRTVPLPIFNRREKKPRSNTILRRTASNDSQFSTDALSYDAGVRRFERVRSVDEDSVPVSDIIVTNIENEGGRSGRGSPISHISDDDASFSNGQARHEEILNQQQEQMNQLKKQLNQQRELLDFQKQVSDRFLQQQQQQQQQQGHVEQVHPQGNLNGHHIENSIVSNGYHQQNVQYQGQTQNQQTPLSRGQPIMPQQKTQTPRHQNWQQQGIPAPLQSDQMQQDRNNQQQFSHVTENSNQNHSSQQSQPVLHKINVADHPSQKVSENENRNGFHSYDQSMTFQQQKENNDIIPPHQMPRMQQFSTVQVYYQQQHLNPTGQSEQRQMPPANEDGRQIQQPVAFRPGTNDPVHGNSTQNSSEQQPNTQYHNYAEVTQSVNQPTTQQPAQAPSQMGQQFNQQLHRPPPQLVTQIPSQVPQMQQQQQQQQRPELNPQAPTQQPVLQQAHNTGNQQMRPTMPQQLTGQNQQMRVPTPQQSYPAHDQLIRPPTPQQPQNNGVPQVGPPTATQQQGQSQWQQARAPTPQQWQQAQQYIRPPIQQDQQILTAQGWPPPPPPPSPSPSQWGQPPGDDSQQPFIQQMPTPQRPQYLDNYRRPVYSQQQIITQGTMQPSTTPTRSLVAPSPQQRPPLPQQPNRPPMHPQAGPISPPRLAQQQQISTPVTQSSSSAASDASPQWLAELSSQLLQHQQRQRPQQTVSNQPVGNVATPQRRLQDSPKSPPHLENVAVPSSREGVMHQASNSAPSPVNVRMEAALHDLWSQIDASSASKFTRQRESGQLKISSNNNNFSAQRSVSSAETEVRSNLTQTTQHHLIQDHSESQHSENQFLFGTGRLPGSDSQPTGPTQNQISSFPGVSPDNTAAQRGHSLSSPQPPAASETMVPRRFHFETNDNPLPKEEGKQSKSKTEHDEDETKTDSKIPVASDGRRDDSGVAQSPTRRPEDATSEGGRGRKPCRYGLYLGCCLVFLILAAGLTVGASYLFTDVLDSVFGDESDDLPVIVASDPPTTVAPTIPTIDQSDPPTTMPFLTNASTPLPSTEPPISGLPLTVPPTSAATAISPPISTSNASSPSIAPTANLSASNATLVPSSLDSMDYWQEIDVSIAGTINGSQMGFFIAANRDGTIVAIGSSPFAVPPRPLLVYRRDENETWTSHGDPIQKQHPAVSVAMSATGETLAVGYADGSVQVLEFTELDVWGGVWVPIGGDIVVREERMLGTRTSVSLSENGFIIAVGALKDDENTALIVQSYIYNVDSDSWIQLGRPKRRELVTDASVYLSPDGLVLTMGHVIPQRGISSGAVEVFVHDDFINYTERSRGVLEFPGNNSSVSLSLSHSGDRMVVALDEQSIIYDYSEERGNYEALFSVMDSTSLTGGSSVSLSNSGSRLAIGNSDGVSTYEFQDADWVRVARMDGTDLGSDHSGSDYGFSVALAGNGDFLCVGAPLNDENGEDTGKVYAYEAIIINE